MLLQVYEVVLPSISVAINQTPAYAVSLWDHRYIYAQTCSGKHCAYPWSDGQTELIYVAG